MWCRRAGLATTALSGTAVAGDSETPEIREAQRRDIFLFFPKGYCSMNLGKMIPGSAHLKEQGKPRT